MTLEPDTGSLRAQIGRYELVRELGRGGMAVVYLARQPDLDRLVALKELAAFGMHDPQMVHRFLREAQIAASLSDPNIVTVHESFIEGDTPYIAMEYLAPGSLRPLVGRLRIDQAIAVMQDVLHGLSAAEKRGIVHRDLKPENLLLTDDGRVKIADFGIAKAVDRVTTAEFQTAAGTTVGTPTYMAPEQAMGLTLTPASDLYSVGVIAYELMVGRLPFEAESPVALLLQHVSDPPPPPLSVNPDLDPQIGAWIERLLVKEPETRTSHAGRAWDELEEIAISRLGPRWRRGAGLPDPREYAEQPPGPVHELESTGDSEYLTVDPDRFEPGRPPAGSTDDQVTFIRAPTPPPAPPREPTPPPAPPMPESALAPVAKPPATPPQRAATPPPPRAATPPPELDATVAPRRALPTPEPLATPEEPRERRHFRPLVWVVVLLVLTAGAAAAAYIARPKDDAAPPAQATTSGSDPAAVAQRTYPTDAFEIRLPADWKPKCIEEQGTCAGQALQGDQYRSAWSKGGGSSALTLVVDRTPLGDSISHVSISELVGGVDDNFATSLPGYERGRLSKAKKGGRTFSFTSEANPPAGTVFVFKHDQDVYVITGTGPDPGAASDAAQLAIDSLKPA